MNPCSSGCRHAPAITANSKVVFTLISDKDTLLERLDDSQGTDAKCSGPCFISFFFSQSVFTFLPCHLSFLQPTVLMLDTGAGTILSFYCPKKHVLSGATKIFCNKPGLLTLDFNFDVDLNSFCLPVLKRTQSSTFSGIYNSLLLI